MLHFYLCLRIQVSMSSSVFQIPTPCSTAQPLLCVLFSYHAPWKGWDLKQVFVGKLNILFKNKFWTQWSQSHVQFMSSKYILNIVHIYILLLNFYSSLPLTDILAYLNFFKILNSNFSFFFVSLHLIWHAIFLCWCFWSICGHRSLVGGVVDDGSDSYNQFPGLGLANIFP